MTLYEKYCELYKLTIDDTISDEYGSYKKQNDYVVKKHVWITMKYLDDHNCFYPGDKTFLKLINDLKQKKEKELLQAINQTLEEFVKRGN